MINLQNIFNQIGGEEYNAGCILLSVSIMCSGTKNRQDSISVARRNRNESIKNKLMIIYDLKTILFIF